MVKTRVMSLAFAAAVAVAPAAMAAMITNGPQTNPGDQSPSWSAQQNVVESHSYDRLLQTSQAFRAQRMRKECGPVTDPQLHSQCIASFQRDEPYVGSSAAPRPYRGGYGR
jgi:hypothetical protein